MYFKSVYSQKLSEARIKVIFRQARFGVKTTCPKCHSRKISYLKNDYYRCRKCWYKFGLITGTHLARLKIPLRFWYEIVWCFVLQFSAFKTKKLLKVKNYERCFKAYQIIREAILTDSRERFLKSKGTFEVDESFYGGQFKNLCKETRFKYRKEGKAKRGRGAKYRKQPVFGIYKRDGEVYLEPIPDCDAPILETIIKKKINSGSKIFSDTWKGYQGLVGLGYAHSKVNHKNEEFVSGKVHINGMEGFWGLSKTNMHVYKGIRKENWIYYLKEMEFRYNNRKLDFDDLVIELLIVLSQDFRRKG